jgi:hypothetical protein
VTAVVNPVHVGFHDADRGIQHFVHGWFSLPV